MVWDPHLSVDLTYRETTGTYHLHHDLTDRTELSTSVLLAVQAIGEEDPYEQPLQEWHVDPDALDQLFVPGTNHDRAPSTLTFPHGEYAITVRATGEITIAPGTTGGGRGRGGSGRRVRG